MRGALLITLLAWAPVQATALSCMAHSVEAAFTQAQADTARFVVVRGELEFDQSLLPKVDYDNQSATPPLTLIDAELSGKSLTTTGFELPFERKVTLAIACFGPWCANAQADTEVLAFVELGEDGDVIRTDPCGGYLFGTPTPEMIRAVLDCAAGKACVPLR